MDGEALDRHITAGLHDSRMAVYRCLLCTELFDVVLERASGQVWATPEECPGCGAGAGDWEEVG